MKFGLTHDRSCVYNINYHIVWSVKYRRKVISPGVEICMRDSALLAAARHGFTIHLFEAGERNHIHCFVSAPPTMPVSDVVQIIKGNTAKKAFACYPELRRKLWGGHLWNPSYYIETIGSVSEENIRRYIEYSLNSKRFYIWQKVNPRISGRRKNCLSLNQNSVKVQG